MDIEGSDGSRTLLEPGSKVEWGRRLGFKSDDRTVSRRHLVFELAPSNEPTRVNFQVTGKNPVWVHSRESGKVNTFRTCDRGVMEIGDMFCVTAKTPVWFSVRKAHPVADNIRRELDLVGRCEVQDFDILKPESIDISHIDPVKEFGVLVIGEEFDGYPKKMIKDMNNWDWFLEEPGEDSEDEEFGKNERKKGGRRKRKKGVENENEDEDWTGGSEEEKELLTKPTKVQKAKYLTRSKDRVKRPRDTGNATTSIPKHRKGANEEEEDVGEEDDEETLGGFIVDSDELEGEAEGIDEDEEEEEFEEDEEEL